MPKESDILEGRYLVCRKCEHLPEARILMPRPFNPEKNVDLVLSLIEESDIAEQYVLSLKAKLAKSTDQMISFIFLDDQEILEKYRANRKWWDIL